MDVVTLVKNLSQNCWDFCRLKKKKEKNPNKQKEGKPPQTQLSIQSKHCITLHWLIHKYTGELHGVYNSFCCPKVWHPSVCPVTESCLGQEDVRNKKVKSCEIPLSETALYLSTDTGGKPMACNWGKWEESLGKQPLQLCFIPKKLSPQAPVAFKN